jgi:hypothetical protein
MEHERAVLRDFLKDKNIFEPQAVGLPTESSRSLVHQAQTPTALDAVGRFAYAESRCTI